MELSPSPELVAPPPVLTGAAAPTRPERGSWAALPAWLLVALAGFFVSDLLVRRWAQQPDDTPALVLAPLAAWATYVRWGELRRHARLPAASGLLWVAAGSLLFPLAWYLRLTFGPRQAVLMLLGSALLSAVVGLLLLEHGPRRLGALAFPLLLFALCLPPPGTVLTSLQVWLKDLVTSLSAAALNLLGVETAREGFVLRVPAGRLLVSEACSGLRSLMGLVSLAVVVAFFRSLGLRSAMLLACLAVLLSIPANVARIAATGLIAERSGLTVALHWHEALGHVVTLAGLGLLLLAARFLPSGAGKARPEPTLPSPARLAHWVLPMALACLALALAASARLHRLPSAVPTPELRRIPLKVEGWVGADAPLAEGWSALRHDGILHRIYRDAESRTMDVVVAFWGAELQSGPHDADECWSAQGWVLEETGMRTLRPGGEAAPVEVALRRYRRPEGTWTYAFWTQQGRVVLSPHPGLFEHRNVLRVMSSPVNTTSRLFVRVGLRHDLGGTDTEARVQDFASRIMAALYEICPWAAPTRDVLRAPAS